jgi:anti-anti-sigma factor
LLYPLSYEGARLAMVSPERRSCQTITLAPSTSPHNRLTRERRGPTVKGTATGGAGGVRLMLGEVFVMSDTTVARLHGDLDLVNVEALRDLLDDICSGTSTQIIIDLGDVLFIDVLSLSVILGAADGLREAGRQLLVEGASNAVRRLCALLNANDILATQLPLQRVAIPPAC